jgi:hypothetical protein
MFKAILFTRPTRLVAGAAVLALAGLVAVAAGDPKPARRAADRGKMVIEAPVKAMLAGGGQPAAGSGGFVNPHVEPGRVKWHPTFAAACRAARKSGKPVLLFQMMGKLDEQFC